MILQKWNNKKHEYEPYKIPNNWNCKTYSNNMDEIVNCAQCGGKVKLGDCYTSLEIHTQIGMGYAVCEECYEEEWKRRRDTNEMSDL